MEAQYARRRAICIKNGDVSRSGIMKVLEDVLRGKVAEACLLGRLQVVDPFPNRDWGGYAFEIRDLYAEFRDDGYDIQFDKLDGFASVAIVSW